MDAGFFFILLFQFPDVAKPVSYTHLTVRNAILDSAKQCCAIEGSYPSSLEHLEQGYGLRVNRDDYVITYEVFAENIMPSVVVVPR